jgi:hypothetical protein
MLDIDQIRSMKAVSSTDRDVDLIDMFGNTMSPYIIIDLFEDDIYVQRAVTSNDEIVHVIDAIAVGHAGGEGRCSWAYHVLHKSKGVFDYTKRQANSIAKEKKTRIEREQAYKRWSNQTENLLRQMYMWDFELLDEAIMYGDEFMEKHFYIRGESG